jgi:hypothetical protein
MIRLRFSTTRSLIPSALIRWRTQCAQSHVEFIRGDGFTLGSRWSLNRADNGVRLRSPISIAEQRSVLEATFPGIDQAFTEGLKLTGTPYNLKGIFGIAAAKDWTEQGSLDCSNFVFTAAERAGVQLLNPKDIAPWKITPRDLQLSELLTFF